VKQFLETKLGGSSDAFNTKGLIDPRVPVANRLIDTSGSYGA